MKPTEHLTTTERPGTYITVMSDSSGPIIVVSDGPGARASRYTPEEAAKLGLAVLEAAGVKPEHPEQAQVSFGSPGHLSQIVFELGRFVKAEAMHSKLAREQAELEAEALELANAAVIECGNPPYPSLERMGEKVLRRWLAVARRAREIAKEATK